MYNVYLHHIIFNRPGVAGAVLQTPLLLIHTFINSSFSSKPSKYHYTQSIRAKELKFWENFHHVSHVRCQVSGVRCLVSYISFFGQSGGASRWRVYNQQGYPV